MEAAAFDIFAPVLESAMVIAAHYAKSTGRDVVHPKDVAYGLMFAARHVTGRQVGSLFPEVWDESRSDSDGEGERNESRSDSDADSDWETVSDSELEWKRYEGTDDPRLVLVNEAADTWDEWEPESLAERALKNAVEKAREQYGY